MALFDKGFLTESKEANKRYEEEVSRTLERMPGGKKEYITISGPVIKPPYAPLDIEGSSSRKP